MLKAIDTPNDTAGHAHALLDAGVQAVGLYLRGDRASKAMVDGLALVGIKRFSVHEKGHPDHCAYFFSLAQAAQDANVATAFAKEIGQPAGSQIYFAVDYDAAPGDLRAIGNYFAQLQQIVKQAGYLCSAYGSGLVCAHLVDAGLAHSGWLAQSRGWAGYEDFKPRAAILQGPSSSMLGFDVDFDTIIDDASVW